MTEPTSPPLSLRARSCCSHNWFCIPAKSLSRVHLAGLFWPESSDEQALTNLRRELHTLRHALPTFGALFRCRDHEP